MTHSRRSSARRVVRRVARFTPTTALAAAASIHAAMSLALLCGGRAAGAQTSNVRYPTAAPIEQYRSKSMAEEIALARTAAPPSISSSAEILVLGRTGYERAVPGTNGFVCLVERSWDASFDDPGFWNPKIRGPNCFNPAAVRTQLPQFLKRTEWVLSGVGRRQLVERTRAAFANHTFKDPEPGALSYMLSKDGHIGDDAAGPWLPHMMFYVPRGQATAWGADAKGSPISGHDGNDIEATVLIIPVRRWSDGSPAPQAAALPPG